MEKMLPRQQKLVIICCLCHQLRRDLLLWVLMVFSSLVFDPFLLFLLLHHQSLFVFLLQVREVTSEYLRKKNRHMFVEVKFKRKNILQYMVVIAGFTTTCTFTIKVVSLNPVHGEVYSTQHYVIKVVSDLRQIDDFPGYSSFLHQ